MGIFDSATKVANPFALGAFVLAAVVAVVAILIKQRGKGPGQAVWPAWVLLGLFMVVGAWVMVKLGSANQPNDYEVVVTVKNPKGVFQNDPIIHCVPPTEQSQDVMSATCKYLPERIPENHKVTVIVDAGGGLQGSSDVDLPTKAGIVTADVQLAAAMVQMASNNQPKGVAQPEVVIRHLPVQPDGALRTPVTAASAPEQKGIRWYASRDEWARHIVSTPLPVDGLTNPQLKTLADQGTVTFESAGVTLKGHAAFGLSGLGLVQRNIAFVSPWSTSDVLESAKTEVLAEFAHGVKGFGCNLMSSLMAISEGQQETYQTVAKASSEQVATTKDWKNPKAGAFLGVVSDQPLDSVEYQSKLSFLMVGSCAVGR